MDLLVLDRVTKRYGPNGVQPAVLRTVSLAIQAGELVAVWGRRRSGRTTLLRVAAGIEMCTEGSVCFDGTDIAKRSVLGVPLGVGYCSTTFPPAVGHTVAEHVAAPLLGHAVRPSDAQRAAEVALRRVGAEALALHPTSELTDSEVTRVVLARALVLGPRLLVMDQPMAGVPLAVERDAVIELLHSLAHRDGIAVLAAVDEASELAGADRALTIDTGELRGDTSRRQPAAVIPLRPTGS